MCCDRQEAHGMTTLSVSGRFCRVMEDLAGISRERESRNADRRTASEKWYGPPRPTSRIQTRKVGTYCRTSLAVNLNDIGPLRSGRYDQIENHAYIAKRSFDLDFKLKFYILRPSHTYHANAARYQYQIGKPRLDPAHRIQREIDSHYVYTAYTEIIRYTTGVHMCGPLLKTMFIQMRLSPW